MADPKDQAGVIQRTAEKVVEALGADPCLLAIVVIVFGCFALIWYTFRHQERMEKIRLQQLGELLKAKGSIQ